MLSAKSIQEHIKSGDISISSFKEDYLKPASYVLTLGNNIEKNGTRIEIDQSGYEIQPGEFIIAFTQEKITLSENIGCLVSTKGSIAQSGVDMLNSSFSVEPLSDNCIKLEIVNHSDKVFKIIPGLKVVKAVFFKVV